MFLSEVNTSAIGNRIIINQKLSKIIVEKKYINQIIVESKYIK